AQSRLRKMLLTQIGVWVMPAGTSGARMDEGMRALADPTRRQILRLVHEDELAAGEIARRFPALSRQASSQHLRVLAVAGLATVRACRGGAASAGLDPRPSGTCLVRLGGDAVMRGAFVELTPHRRIVFTLGWEPADGAPPVPPGSSTVTITLAAGNGGTILTL